MKEEWVDLEEIVENGKKYKVSNLGRVWSGKTNRVLRQAKGGSGYYFVCFSQKSKVKQYDVHRLVALAFIANNDESRNEVNHIDGNKENNHLTNLEWVTRSENKKHAYRTGLRKPLPSSNMLNAIKSSCRPVAVHEQPGGKLIAVYQSAMEFVRHNKERKIPNTTVCYQCQNESFSTKNPFYFRYATGEQVEYAKKKGIFYGSVFVWEEAQ